MTEPTHSLGLKPAIDIPSKRDMNQEELAKAEQIIARGKQTFMEVGIALMDVRDRRGYRFTHPTFEIYCREKWGWTASRSRQLIGAVETVREIESVTTGNTLVDINERQARAVKQLGVEVVKQAAAELADPTYEPHEDAEPAQTPQKQEHVIARGTKEILKRAAEIKQRVKDEKRQEREKEQKANAKAFKRTSKVGTVEIHLHDARKLGEIVKHGSCSLVVTSPPYNQGVEYTTHDDAMPAEAYRLMLSQIFTACREALCDGGRIAVVVPFGVGRNPWVPFAPLIYDLLRACKFELDGQIIWLKGTLDSSTAWGSFRLPTRPALRDMAEAIIVAHKGANSLDVPASALLRDSQGAYSPFLADGEEFALLTSGVWHITPESANRVNHPAPFPIKLAENLIRLYAFPGAHVLDPMAGSGAVGVAAVRLGCMATLLDIDPGYCRIAEKRCAAAQEELKKEPV